MSYEDYTIEELDEMLKKQNEERFNDSLKTNSIKHFIRYENRYDKNYKINDNTNEIQIMFTNKKTKEYAIFSMKEENIELLPF